MVTDLPTLLWSPHGHDDAVDNLLGLAQVVLLDSVDEPDERDALHRSTHFAAERGVYVVDLAWLRTTPWRERVAASFDPLPLRPSSSSSRRSRSATTSGSRSAALLLAGWLASRLGWRTEALVSRGADLHGHARARRQDVTLRLVVDPTLDVPGLAGLTVETATGRHLSLDRGPGGLRARYRNRRGDTARVDRPGRLARRVRDPRRGDPSSSPA